MQLGECQLLLSLRVGIPSSAEDALSSHRPHIRSISHHPCDPCIGSLVGLQLLALALPATRLTSIQLHHLSWDDSCRSVGLTDTLSPLDLMADGPCNASADADAHLSAAEPHASLFSLPSRNGGCTDMYNVGTRTIQWESWDKDKSSKAAKTEQAINSRDLN